MIVFNTGNATLSNSATDLSTNFPTPTADNQVLIVQAQNPLTEHLPLGGLISLSLTCKTVFAAYGEPNHTNKTTSILASRVLWNKPPVVKSLLEGAKDKLELITLLTNTVRIPVELPSGLLFKGYTPFQAALCTWNTSLCQLLKAYFAQIPDGPEKIRTQINKIFPKGVEAFIKVQKNKAAAFKEETLRPLITTLSAASDTEVKILLENKRDHSNLGKAIALFREKFKEENDADPVFNPFYLQAANDLHTECYKTFKSCEAVALFKIQVIGYIQCYFPAYALQAIAQGISCFINPQKTFLHSFNFNRVMNNVTHIDIKIDEFRGLGFDYWGYQAGLGVKGDWLPAVGWEDLFMRFIGEKQQTLQIFCEEYTSQPHPCNAR